MTQESSGKPDLSFGRNHRWAIRHGAIWTLLMLPSDIASQMPSPSSGLVTVLTFLGMVGFFSGLFASLETLSGGVKILDLRRRLGKFPWPLMLGVAAYFFLFSALTYVSLLIIFGNQAKVVG